MNTKKMRKKNNYFFYYFIALSEKSVSPVALFCYPKKNISLW